MIRFQFMISLFFLLLLGISAQETDKNTRTGTKTTNPAYVVKFHPGSKEKMYEAIDSNENGSLDTFYYYDTKGQRVRQEIDSNHDGSVDVWIYFRDGIYIQRIVKDTDHDGKVDTERTY